jgi:hypothetical protein
VERVAQIVAVHLGDPGVAEEVAVVELLQVLVHLVEVGIRQVRRLHKEIMEGGEDIGDLLIMTAVVAAEAVLVVLEEQ